jgi:hypothetical protein
MRLKFFVANHFRIDRRLFLFFPLGTNCDPRGKVGTHV